MPTPNDYGLLHVRKEQTTALQIKVTKSSLKRAHDIFAVLHALLEAIDGALEIDGDGRTIIRLDGEEIRVSLQEQTKRVKDPKELAKPYWQRRRYEPTGILTLSMSAYGLWNRRCNWKDGKRTSLEEQLPAVVAELIPAAAAVREARLESERRAREWERSRREQVIYNERWEKLNQLLEDRRKFETLMALLDRIDEDEDTRAWLAWAKNEVRKTDPLANLASYLQLSEWTEKEALEIGADLWPEAKPE